MKMLICILGTEAVPGDPADKRLGAKYEEQILFSVARQNA